MESANNQAENAKVCSCDERMRILSEAIFLRASLIAETSLTEIADG